jgi:hypothetical protein
MSHHGGSTAVAPPARSRRVASGTIAPLVVGSAGHLAAGGSWSAAPVAVAAVLLVGPAWILSRRELGLPSIAMMLVSGQVMTHAALMLSSSGDHSDMAIPAGPVVLYHFLAALVTSWWLRRGEQRLWEGARRVMAAVCRCVCHLLRTAPHAGANCHTVRVIPAPESGARRFRILLRHAIVLRGPPVLG